MIIEENSALQIKTLNSWTSTKKPQSSYLQQTSSDSPTLLKNVVTRHLLQGHTLAVTQRKHTGKIRRC